MPIRPDRAPEARARETIILAHLPLARRLALRYNRAPHCADDLIQVASVGLIKAADRWDPGRGLAFSTYAVPTVLGELRHYCRDFTWAIRPPRGIQDLCLAIGKAREQLHDAIGREPTVGALAERLDRTPDEIIAALAAERARTLESLDAALDLDLDDSGYVSTGDLIGNNDEEYERVEARDTVERLTSILDARAREVLRLRHENDLHQAEIAARLGLTQVHVSRILRASYDRLAAYCSGTRGLWLHPVCSREAAGGERNRGA
jgi:RNA polymerase sigma-B factor